MRSIMTRVVFLALFGLLIPTLSPAHAADHWPSWRGANSDGFAPDTNPPTQWSETENVKWKVPLKVGGQSTPVIWGDRIFILGASSADESVEATRRPNSEEQVRGKGRSQTVGTPSGAYDFKVLCLDRETGKTLWERTAITTVPHAGHHQAGSFSPYSAITDGEKVWASFGSRGLYCFDVEGNPLWSQPLDPMTIKYNFGEGSSPTIAGDAIIVVQDHEGPSTISAFDKTTGKPLWKKDRDEGTSWSSPVAIEVDGAIQVVVNASNRIRSYDAKSGEVIWECGGMTPNVIPTPVVGFGRVYCSSGYHGSMMKAITLGHTGDLTDSDAVAWNFDQGTPYVSSPVLAGDRIYQLEDIKPFLSCADAQSGEVLFTRERIPELKQVYASPVATRKNVFIMDRNGNMAVIERSKAFNLVTVNHLDDGFDASPIIVGDALYLKGNNSFYCIAAP